MGAIIDNNKFVATKLPQLPSNQLIIEDEICDSQPQNVIVTDETIKWHITLRQNIVDNGDGTFSCEKMEYDRDKESLTQQELEEKLRVNFEEMFILAKAPEYSIQMNRTSAVALIDMIIKLKTENDKLAERITILEGGA